MDSRRYGQIKDVFATAREMQARERAAYLEQACSGDPELRSEVEELLEGNEKLDDDVMVRALAPRDPGDVANPPEGPGTVLGHYRIIEAIGEGGMGTVWRARQEEPVRRQVALKIIKLGMDTREVVVRFEAERQALALMDHPHIAKVLDGGATETGRPYFVMELVDGEPITDFCDEHRLALRERLELFSKVCEAIQHAHQKGIIHRDIKPTNVLVSLESGVPVPRVIDFGIAKATSAKLTQKTMITQDAQIIGTPEYMAPEQASVSSVDIDTRADVYSLGVLLYELLTGTTPFDMRTVIEAGYLELLRTIRDVDPVKPSTRISTLGEAASSIAASRHANVEALGKRLRGDLDWIVMKALEKDRARRYETASSFASDVQRYLGNEPVLAAPPSAAYIVRKFVRRNRLAVTAGVVVVTTFIVATVGLALLYARSVESEARATREAARATRGAATSKEALGFMTEMFEVSDPSQARGETVTAREILDRGVGRIAHELRNQPEIRSTLMASMGRVYRGLGLYDQSEQLLRKAAADVGARLGEDHSESLRLSSDLASVLASQSRFADAERLLRPTLEHQKRVVGPEHTDTLESLVVLSQILESLSQFPEAGQLAGEALEIAQRTLEADHELTLLARHQLGLVYNNSARFEEAEQQFLTGLEARRRTVGDDHPETLALLHDLGRLYVEMGKFDEAEALLMETRETSLRVFGGEHLWYLKSCSELARLYKEQGRLEEVEAIYRSVLDIQRRTLGDDHLETLLSLNSLGVALALRGQYEEAEPYHLEALDGLRRKFGEQNEHTINTSSNLALLYMEIGRLDDAEAHGESAWRESVALHGSEHPTTLLRLENLGAVMYRQGDLAGAAHILGEVLDGRRQALGDDHINVTRTLVNMAVVRANAGDLEGATEIREELLERAQAGLHLNKSGVLEQILALRVDLNRAGDLERASECTDMALRLSLELSGAEHPGTLALMRDRLTNALGLERWGDVQSVAHEYYTAHVVALGQDHASTRSCLDSIVAGYEQHGDTEQASEWREMLPDKGD